MTGVFYVPLRYAGMERTPNKSSHKANSGEENSPALKPVWNDRSISLSSMIRMMRSLVTSIVLYATLTAELQRRIEAMEMKCYRKILHTSYKDHVTNKEVRAKIQPAIWPHEDLLTIVKRHKLQWYGHVFRSSGLAKTILQGTVKGGRRQGRQRKWWEDNIRKWTGLEFGKSQRSVENKEKWRKLVAKSSVVPQRPSRLRYWWWTFRSRVLRCYQQAIPAWRGDSTFKPATLCPICIYAGTIWCEPRR